MKKIINYIKTEWLFLYILAQPFLDVISYFQTKFIGHSYTWIIRLLMIFISVIYIFIKSNKKKKIILFLLPYTCYFIIHILNLKNVNSLSIISDTKMFIQIFQLPILFFFFKTYIEETKYDINKLKKAFAFNFITIASVIFLSYITHTYEYTYITTGILGWFSGSNTPSMILCAVAPWAMYYFTNNSNKKSYTIISLIVAIILYFNATKACYITLIASIILMLYISILCNSKNKKYNILVFTLLLILSLGLYKFSFTFDMLESKKRNSNDNGEYIKLVIDEETKNLLSNKNFTKEQAIKILRSSYIYEEIMNFRGEDAVYEEMKDNITQDSIANNRLRKKVNARISYKQSNLVTKITGIGFSHFNNMNLDLENDITAIFYYYGYLGLIVYLIYPLSIILIICYQFLKDKELILNSEYYFILFLIFLLIFGGEYSGAFLRKPNSNIYLIYLMLFGWFSFVNKKES